MIAEDIVRVTERFLREPTFVVSLVGRLAIVEQDRVRFRPALTQSLNIDTLPNAECSTKSEDPAFFHINVAA
jgi:hypothetical protein